MSNIGPTGESRIANDPHDQGGLWAEIFAETETQTLRVNFGTSITFLRMTRDEALAFSQALRTHAMKLRSASDN
jgi:hypothetical protein